MTTHELLYRYKRVKIALQDEIHKIMLTRMVSDNLRDIIPQDYNIGITDYATGVKISPVNDDYSVDNFPKMTKKLSKIFGKKPSVNIDQSTMCATWWVYPDPYGKFQADNQVRIELVFGNTEKCEVVYKEETYQVTELTGYCKMIKERCYDTN